MITFFRKVIWRHRLDETVGTRSWSKNTKSISLITKDILSEIKWVIFFDMP